MMVSYEILIHLQLNILQLNFKSLELARGQLIIFLKKNKKYSNPLSKNLDLGIAKTAVAVQQNQKKINKQQINQMEQDLLAIEYKIGNSENLKNMIEEDYYDKKDRFREAYSRLEELKKFKEETKSQMCGFLVMYEMKREQTLKDLSKKLQQTPGYIPENLLNNNE